MNPFNDPPMDGCICPNAKGLLMAAFAGTPPDLCPVHDAARIASDRARVDADQLRTVIDEMKANDELTRRRKARDADRQALDEALHAIPDPMEQAVTRAVLPLNANPSDYPALAGFLNPTGDDAA